MSYVSNHIEETRRDILEGEKGRNKKMVKALHRSASRSVGDRGAAECIDAGARWSTSSEGKNEQHNLRDERKSVLTG